MLRGERKVALLQAPSTSLGISLHARARVADEVAKADVSEPLDEASIGDFEPRRHGAARLYLGAPGAPVSRDSSC